MVGTESPKKVNHKQYLGPLHMIQPLKGSERASGGNDQHISHIMTIYFIRDFNINIKCDFR